MTIETLSPLRLVSIAAGREVGAGNEANQVAELLDARERRRRLAGLGTEVRLVDDPDAGVDDLPQVVRRDVGGHADGDAGGSVDEEIRERRREHGRLLRRLVVVRREVDRLLVEVGHHVVGERLEPRLRVAHGRGRIAVDRSEVALAVDQGVPHVEVLREADERVVDRGVAVRVEVPHHLADDLGALAVPARRREPHRLHAVQHAAMRRLEPVASVGKRAPDDHAHGVIHVRALHLVFDVDGVLLRDQIGHTESVACEA